MKFREFKEMFFEFGEMQGLGVYFDLEPGEEMRPINHAVRVNVGCSPANIVKALRELADWIEEHNT